MDAFASPAQLVPGKKYFTHKLGLDFKITAVYGQIDENGSSVRKWLARKMPITDKMVKKGRLSVKIQTFRTRFYGQMLQKAVFVRKSSS